MEVDREFWARVWSGLQRLIALVLYMLAHKAINWGLAFLFPPSMIGALSFLEDISAVFFGLVYVYMLWDMSSVFIPALRAKGTKVAPQTVTSEAEHE